jgi:26S proteasome regulatory subunit N1
MVSSDEGSNECLKYCLEGSQSDLIGWGHEYLRALSGEVSQVYNKRVEKQEDTQDLMALVNVIIPYFMKHNEEPEAVDLLMEVESLSKLQEYTNETNYERVCLYLLNCAQYAADPEEMMIAYHTGFLIYMSQKKYP